ncbi:MAG: dTMP kinase [Clostridiales bacterium]|nr:dTMP kinase [Clostridiales bacterium]
MNKGLFISIEGPDGSGKSTQLKNIIKYFQDKEVRLVFTREPGGTKIGEKIRSIILDRDNMEMTDMTEALLYAAARAQHVEEKIRPSLLEGKTVLCDRYVDSSIAYQGYGRNLGESVSLINDYAISGIKPDVTIFLALEPEVGRNRIKHDDKDRLEIEKADFHQRVYDGYMRLAEEEPDRYQIVDASKDIESVKNDIFRVLDGLGY